MRIGRKARGTASETSWLRVELHRLVDRHVPPGVSPGVKFTSKSNRVNLNNGQRTMELKIHERVKRGCERPVCSYLRMGLSLFQGALIFTENFSLFQNCTNRLNVPLTITNAQKNIKYFYITIRVTY